MAFTNSVNLFFVEDLKTELNDETIYLNIRRATSCQDCLTHDVTGPFTQVLVGLLGFKYLTFSM